MDWSQLRVHWLPSTGYFQSRRRRFFLSCTAQSKSLKVWRSNTAERPACTGDLLERKVGESCLKWFLELLAPSMQGIFKPPLAIARVWEMLKWRWIRVEIQFLGEMLKWDIGWDSFSAKDDHWQCDSLSDLAESWYSEGFNFCPSSKWVSKLVAAFSSAWISKERCYCYILYVVLHSSLVSIMFKNMCFFRRWSWNRSWSEMYRELWHWRNGLFL